MKNLLRKRNMLFTACCMLLMMLAVPAFVRADWNEEEPYKWLQRPDLTPTGIDICVDDTGDLGQRTIGDDFLCSDPDPVTGVHIWGSWRGDFLDQRNVGQIDAIHVQFYTDDPVGEGGTNPDNEWSTPDILVYDQWFDPAQFTMRDYYQMPQEEYEWWWDPWNAISLTPLGDQYVVQVNIDLTDAPFEQEGTSTQPIIYWLVIEVKINSVDFPNTSFGWKTRDRWDGHYMDDAVWYGAQWVDIEYPEGHDYYPDSVDMSFVLTTDIEDELDYGDAPDAAGAVVYQTLLINDGPRHVITPVGPWLGDAQDNPDPETDGQPNATATGDDADGNDDEDGVQMPSALTENQVATITFEVNSGDGAGGTVSGWIDYNQNQIFGDVAVEQVIAASYANGTYSFNTTPPVGSAGTTYARFRISRDAAGTAPFGFAADGEVEDYLVTINEEEPPVELEFGDAPEGGLAYPTMGTIGAFPTCMTVGPAGWIQHNNFGAWFGPGFDFEADGNAGQCPNCFPLYDQDECFMDGDAGLIVPDSYTIDSALNVVTCTGVTPGVSLGGTCGNAAWGPDIDIDVTNLMPSNTTGYVNLLVDWNQDGQWAGASPCPSISVPEHALVNFPVPNGYSGALSGLMPPRIKIGPNPGYVWARFSITEVPVAPGWDGSGAFEDGETEDYLLHVVRSAPDPNETLKFQQVPLNGVTIDQVTYWGHDELSTAYRNPDLPEEFVGCYMADDFADLEHSPVIKVKWWGSYLENEIDPYAPVTRFLIAFERDIPASGHPSDQDYIPSHPGEPLLTQIVHLTDANPLNPGEYSETYVSAGGPPCYEAMYEYEALLENPFPQDPNTVYWIKIVALVDIAPHMWYIIQNSGLPMCEFLNLPFSSSTGPSQQQYGLEEPLTRWGWHNRDYTQFDPYAATPPAVVPGEHNPMAWIPTLPPIGSWDPADTWHFQDDAVAGDVIFNEMNFDLFQDPATWRDEYYKYSLPYCVPATQGIDGPDEIELYSKDLAFELTTPTICMMPTHPDYSRWVQFGQPDCWCYRYQCRGDANGKLQGSAFTGYYPVGPDDLTVLLAAYTVLEANIGTISVSGVQGICADFDHASQGSAFTGYYPVGPNDLNILLAYYTDLVSTVPLCDNTYLYFWTSP